MKDFLSLSLLCQNRFFLLLAALAIGCNSNTSSNVDPPGEDKTTKTQALETGAELLQNEAPVNQISMYLDGFHFANGNMDHQMEAHHYCMKLNEEVTQCIIYDGNQKDALIIGIEYIKVALSPV